MRHLRLDWWLCVICVVGLALGCSEPEWLSADPSDDEIEDPVQCGDAELYCGTQCVDPETDSDHCGGCDRACEPQEVCDGGECALGCSGGLIPCDGGCRDPETDADHCGECNNECGPGRICSGGSCELTCQEGLTKCGDTCRDLQTDPNHCGDCDAACDDGEVCNGGTCELTCQEGLTKCEGACRDLQTDPNHCGNCGAPCQGGMVCSGGECGLSCQGELTECDGVCRNYQTDPNHCGGCNQPCEEGEVCSNGTCELSCQGELSKCDGVCRNYQTDPNHCGGCNQPCEDGEVCDGGECTTSCGPGLQECDGACRNIQTDPNYCGGCGPAHDCGPDEVCSGGSCEPSCGGIYAECDGACRNTQTDRNYCGSCANSCEAGEICSGGNCQATCDDGLTDCGGVCRNTSSDEEHCGECFNACGELEFCDGGLCQSPTFRMEGGAFSTPNGSDDASWPTIDFRQSYPDPPVVFATPSTEGGDPAYFRIRNVTTTSFETVLAEPDGENGAHTGTTTSYFAVEPGVTTLENGSRLAAGRLETTELLHADGGSDTSVSLPDGFDNPVVLAQIQTLENETNDIPSTTSDPWLTATVRDVGPESFDVALEGSECTSTEPSGDETIGWVAFDAGAGGTFVDGSGNSIGYETIRTDETVRGWDEGGTPISFDSDFGAPPRVVAAKQTRNEDDGGWLRYGGPNASQVSLRVDEDRCEDDERGHSEERAGIFVFSDDFSLIQ